MNAAFFRSSLIVWVFLLLVQPQLAAAQTVFPDPPLAQADIGVDVYKLEWHPCGEFLAVASADGAHVYNLDLKLEAFLHQGEIVYGLSWSPDGQQLAVTYDTTIEIWAWDALTRALSLERVLQGDGIQVGAFWSPDGSRIAALEGTTLNEIVIGTVRFWATASWVSEGTVAKTFAYELFVPNGNRVSWSPDGMPLLLTAGFYMDQQAGQYFFGTMQVAVIDAVSRQVVREIVPIGHSVRSVSWRPSGDMFAVGSSEGTAIYDFSTGAFLKAFFSTQVRAVDWSRDGRYIVGSNEILDVTTQQDVGNFARDTGISANDWHPAGDKLATADSDGVIEIEDLTVVPGIELTIHEPCPRP